MKICHCVKLTEEESKAFKMVSTILDELDDDTMLSSGFDNVVTFGDIRSWLNDVLDFIHSFGE